MIKPWFAHSAALLAPALVFTAVFAHRPASAASEIARLRAHFAVVEQELLARDVSHLAAAQRAARARHIERLRAYARAGVFPKNTDFAARRVPYFIDRFGTRCAMAYLIEQSGHGDYARRVAEKSNNAYIADIARDPELAPALLAWLEQNGLTLQEAARIQPSYDDGGCVGCVVDGSEPVTPAYAAGTATVVLFGGASTWLNAGQNRSRFTGALGLASGALGVTMGFFHLDDRGANQALGALNLGLGAAATYFGVRALTTRTQPPAERPVASVTPWLAPSGASGVAVQVRF